MNRYNTGVSKKEKYMKLAEALILRADLQKRFARLKERLTASAKVQEGDRPAENPQELLAELDTVLTELTDIIQRVNKTNSASKIGDGSILADRLTERDSLKAKHNAFTEVANAATVKQDRYSKSEVKFKSTINVSEIQKKADELAKSFRELDTRIQEANWSIELLDK